MKTNLAQDTPVLPLLRVLLGFILAGGITAARAQILPPTELMNVLDNTPIDQSARKIVVLIHGWTGMTTGTPLPWETKWTPGYNRYEDNAAAPQLNYLYNILRVRLLGSGWKLVAYPWEKDASTGSFPDGVVASDQTGYGNAVQAALNARDHGTHLGTQLSQVAPDLRYVHFIAHSAGAWVAREALRVLLEQNPYLEAQLTLLDPFIPDAFEFAPSGGVSWPTGLNTERMNSTAALQEADRIYSLENYYADDFPGCGDWPTISTQERFYWRSNHDINLQVEWGVWPGFICGYTHYDYHSGPVEFYADSIAGIMPWALDFTKVIGPAYDPSQVGWYRSLFLNGSAFPRILTQPKDQSAPIGKSATLRVVASRATAYKWYRNGQFTGVTDPEINLLATEANEGYYVVQVSNGSRQTFSEKARFTVATATTKPEIIAVSPRSLVGKPLGQTQRITIVGSGFTSASRLNFHDGGVPYDGRVPDFISSNELKYDIAVGPNAAEWTVKVVNGAVESDPYAFNVTAAQDTTAPSAPIGLAATVSLWSSDTQVLLDWTNPSDPSGIAKAWVKIGALPTFPTDGVSYRLPANKPLRLSLPISEGTRVVHIWLEDGAGNRDHANRASVTPGVDAVSPVVRITSPVSNPLTTKLSTITLSGTYEDNLSGVVSVKWRHLTSGSGDASTSGSGASGTWNTPAIALQPGLNLLTVTAADAAGNVASSTILVTSLGGSNSGTVSVTITPQGAIDQGAKWRVNGGQWRNNGEVEPNVPTGPRFVDFINIPGGWRTPAGFVVNVTAGQPATGTGNYTRVFVNEPPNAPSNPAPANGANSLSRVNPSFSWTGGDPDSPVQYAFFLSTDPHPDLLNSIEVVGYGGVSGSSVGVTRTLLSGTTYYWKVNAMDDITGVVVESPIWQFTTEYSYADLLPTGLSVDGNVEPGSSVTLATTVKNQGSFTSPVSYVYFYLSRQPGARETRLNGNFSLAINPALGPGEERTFTYAATLNNLQAGQSFIDVWIDSSPSGTAAEDNYANNLKSLAINYIDGSSPEVTYAGLKNAFVKTGAASSLEYVAHDDIGIATLDFYYSVDAGLNWTPIQEGYVPPTPPEYGAVFSWTIPANLPVGSNLTIRVVARDTSGNWGERIAGPYVVHDGTAPTVTVVLPNGGEVWDMGSQQQIKWTLSAPNGVGRFNVYFYHDNTADFLAVPVPSGNGSYNWTLPSPFSTTTGKIRFYVEDVNGNAAEDYSDGFFTIRDTSAPPPAPWTTPAIVTSTAPGDPGGQPHIVTDPSGNAHLVYGLSHDSGLHQVTFRYKKRVNNAWTAPTAVTLDVTSIDSQYGANYGVSEWRLAVDGNGRPHLVWSTIHGGGLLGLNQNDIFYSTFDGANWTAPLNLSVDLPGFSGVATVSREPSIQLDPAGVVHVVWTDGWFFNLDNSRTGVPNIYYRKRDPVSGWGTPSKVTDSASYYPALVSGSANILHLAFIGYPANASSILYMTNAGVGWSSPASAAAGADSTVDITSDGNNHPHIVWRDYNATAGQDEVAYTYYDGASWSLRKVLCSAGSVRQPAISLDTFGRPHVTWESLIAAGDFRYKLLYSFKDGSAWSPQIQLNLASQFVAEYSSDSTVSLANNEMHVVWNSTVNGNTEVLYNHALVGSTSDMFAPTVTVAAPVSGAILPIGATVALRWTAADNVGVTGINLDYTINNGTAWTVIAANQPNTGTLNWTVPNLGASTSQIRVTARDAAGNTAYAFSGSFTTADLTPPSIALVSPADGAVLAGNSTVSVNWTALDNVAVTRVDLEYSLDNGKTWFELAAELSNTGSYAWAVPNTATTMMLIRATASDAVGLSASSVSAQPLTILPANTPPIAPHSPFPVGRATQVSVGSTTFLWSSGDLDGDALTYQLRLGTSPNPPLLTTIPKTNYSPANLAYATTYYWQIVVSDGHTEVAGPVWSFTTANITPAILTITPSNRSKTYGQTMTFAGTEFTANGLVGGDTVTGVTLSSAGAGATATVAGSPYGIAASAATGTGLGNYTISYQPGTLTVNKATATVALNAASLSQVYDGAAKVVSATTTPAGLAVTLTYNGNATPPSAAGSYPVTATVNDPNYTGSASGTLTVNMATATVVLNAASLSQTYDGSAKVVSATTTPSGLAVTLAYNGSATPPTAAGSYPVTATVNDANYTGSASGTLTVSRVALTVAGITAANKPYDGKTTATITGTPTLSGAIAGDVVTITGTPAGTFENKNVGNNKPVIVTGLSLSGADAGNYTLSLPGLSGSITRANLSVTGLAAESKVYDGTPTATITGTPALSGVLGSDAVSIMGTPAGQFANKNVGNNKPVTVTGLSLSGADAGNYTLSLPGLSASITPAPLVVSADNKTRTIGAANPPFTGTSTGLQAGDAIKATYNSSATITSPAGPYPIVPSLADPDGDLPNYNVTLNNGTLTITSLGLKLGEPSFAGHRFGLSIATEPGLRYTLEYTVSLTAPVWTPVQTVVGDGTARPLDDANATDSARFYRVRAEPQGP